MSPVRTAIGAGTVARVSYTAPMLFLGGKRLEAAKVAADRAVLRFVHGLQLVMDGGIAQVGDTPKDVVFKDGKLEVWRYRPPESEEVELGHDTLVISPS